MLVRCIENTGKTLSPDYLDARSGYTLDTEFEVSVGCLYTVYGMTVNMGHLWYYVCQDEISAFPIWFPPPLFEVLDARLSRYWHFVQRKNVSPAGVVYITELFAFPEWAHDQTYYERLLDDDTEALRIFQSYKGLMDKEFSDAEKPPCE